MIMFWCEHAWLPPGRVAHGVLLGTEGDRIVDVRPGSDAPPGSQILPGLVIPGLANAHSHAFHRALRARTQRGTGDFWTWRRQMYAVADRLDPDTYLRLARATYAEMALAGITCVGEFHYLHHPPGGGRYDDPNAMGAALIAAAADAGVRLTLLDACYLAGGFGEELSPSQQRFSDRDAAGWVKRADALAALSGPAVRIAAAIHSVRAVPRDQMPDVAAWARSAGGPLHVHLSEQVAENDACMAAHGMTPTALLAGAGALGPATVAVHATHLSDGDVATLSSSGTGVCLCPTTERDLADGIGPARVLADASVGLSLGSDSHAVIDLFEEARAVELDERLATRRRGHFPAADLLAAATEGGYRALGWPDGGRLGVGALADFAAVDLASLRTAGGGAAAETIVFAATCADVTDVVVGGRRVVRDRRHQMVADPGAALAAAIAEVAGP